MNYHQYPVPVWTTQEKWFYTIKKYPWKVKTIIRDNYKCRDCNIGSEKLVVHHIDMTGGKENENNSIHNLVTLCKKCHANRHGYNTSVKSKNIVELLEKYSDGNKNLVSGAGVAISKEIGLSRERVRQLSNKLGYITYNNKKNPFLDKICIYCNSKFRAEKRKNFCSTECLRQYRFYKYNVLLQCKNCGFYFLSPKGRFLSHGRFFCNKSCFGSFNGKNYGFGANPQNASGSLPKYSISEIKKQFSKDFTLKEFAKHFKYKSLNGAKNAINSLILLNEIEEYRIKGLYRIKKNPLLT